MLLRKFPYLKLAFVQFAAERQISTLEKQARGRNEQRLICSQLRKLSQLTEMKG